MILGEVFDICKDIELRHAKLYANLSLILGELDERVALFWESMSTEEWQHYIMIAYGRSILELQMGLDEMVVGLRDLDIDRIFEIIHATDIKLSLIHI